MVANNWTLFIFISGQNTSKKPTVIMVILYMVIHITEFSSTNCKTFHELFFNGERKLNAVSRRCKKLKTQQLNHYLFKAVPQSPVLFLVLVLFFFFFFLIFRFSFKLKLLTVSKCSLHKQFEIE